MARDFAWKDAYELTGSLPGQASNYQASGGGMCYYIPDERFVSPYLSAYTAIAFNWLKEQGYEVPVSVENRLHDYLATMLRRDVAPTFYTRGMASTVRAVALAALAKNNRITLDDLNRYYPHVKEMDAAIEYAAKAGIGIIAMKTQAGVFWDKERQHQINMKAALKWALSNKNVHTAIPGFTTFDQMNLDLSVMEDLTLSPEEKEDLSLGNEMGLNGLYCQQCGECESQCRKSLDIPTIMRSYMYAYGYKNFNTARETLLSAEKTHHFCQDCDTCSVTCSLGFNVKDRITDIARIKNIPSDFLA